MHPAPSYIHLLRTSSQSAKRGGTERNESEAAIPMYSWQCSKSLAVVSTNQSHDEEAAGSMSAAGLETNSDIYRVSIYFKLQKNTLHI